MLCSGGKNFRNLSALGRFMAICTDLPAKWPETRLPPQGDRASVSVRLGEERAVRP
jgi:hypothetical protein